MYFVTLIPIEYNHNNRCIGFTSKWEEVERLLTYRDNEGLYGWLVVEDYSEGFDTVSESVLWARWDGRWVRCDRPEFANKICNWAIC